MKTKFRLSRIWKSGHLQEVPDGLEKGKQVRSGALHHPQEWAWGAESAAHELVSARSC